MDSKKFQIVFVSSDSDETSFQQYFHKMPWLSMPFDDSEEIRTILGRKFKVQGIPSLVFVDAKTGETVCEDARSEVMADPEAASFPWKTPSRLEVLQNLTFVDNKGATKTFKEVQNADVLGVYFSGMYFTILVQDVRWR